MKLICAAGLELDGDSAWHSGGAGKAGDVQEIGNRMEVDEQREIPSALWICVCEHLNFIT